MQRWLRRFNAELDHGDAVAFAEKIMESWERVTPQGGAPSVPSLRERNLALAFLNMKYPFQCCHAKDRCGDCPNIPHDVPCG